MSNTKKITNTTEEVTPYMTTWLLGGNPVSIEEQEKRGQDELCNSCQLPTKLSSTLSIAAEEYYEALGIKVLRESKGDKLFYDVVMPKDWSIQHTEHSMWSNLVDNKNRIRATIFYKAAFYDRDAYIIQQNFVQVEKDFIKDDAQYACYSDRRCVLKVVNANGEILKQSNEMPYSASESTFDEYRQFILDKYPDMQTNPTAYWD